jgi:hypothetical protein
MQFQKIVDNFVNVIDKLANVVEKEKIKVRFMTEFTNALLYSLNLLDNSLRTAVDRTNFI